MTNAKASDFVECQTNTDQDILNTESATNFRNSIKKEVIDLPLFSRTPKNRVSRWRVSDEPFLLGHL